MQSVLAVVFVLGALIFFHELGHFIVARFLGVGVKTFSLGFGPMLLKKRFGKTVYALSAVPLGGYVSLAGEREDEDVPEEFTDEESLSLRPAWQRMCVVAAGPIFNFVLAFLIYFALFWTMGEIRVLPVIGEVVADSPADEAGIRSGDRVTAVDGVPVAFWTEMAEAIAGSEGRTLAMTIERKGADGAGAPELLTVSVTPEESVRVTPPFGEEVKTYLVGIQGAGETVNLSLSGLDSFVEAGKQTWFVIKMTATAFIKIFERVVPLDTVGGPIMIAQLVSQEASNGFANLLYLTAAISINLGLINLLPIPILDGGHLVFFGIEALRGRPVNRKIQERAMQVGIVLIICLMVFATLNDIVRQFR